MTNKNNLKKKFDCVEMMHEGAARVQAELANKSFEERVKYWNEKTQSLCERQAKLREHTLKAQEQR